MSTMTLGFTANRPRTLSRWNGIKKALTEWRRRAHSRSELASLSGMDLHDIGVSQTEAASEASKPFWMA